MSETLGRHKETSMTILEEVPIFERSWTKDRTEFGFSKENSQYSEVEVEVVVFLSASQADGPRDKMRVWRFEFLNEITPAIPPIWKQIDGNIFVRSSEDGDCRLRLYELLRIHV